MATCASCGSIIVAGGYSHGGRRYCNEGCYRRTLPASDPSSLPPRGSRLKSIAKWVAILWSLFCLIGVASGCFAAGSSLSKDTSDAGQAGAAIGMGCGMAMWVGIWGAIAGPSLLVYLLSGRSQPIQVQVQQPSASPVKLCASCGKYYEGSPRFCPNCGTQLNNG